MLVLKLTPTPTAAPPSYTPSGRGAFRVVRTSPLERPRRLMALQLSSAVSDYDALMDGEDNLFIGEDRLLAIP